MDPFGWSLRGRIDRPGMLISAEASIQGGPTFQVNLDKPEQLISTTESMQSEFLTILRDDRGLGGENYRGFEKRNQPELKDITGGMQQKSVNICRMRQLRKI